MQNVMERIAASKPASMPFYVEEYDEIYKACGGDIWSVMSNAFCLGYIKGREKGCKETGAKARVKK